MRDRFIEGRRHDSCVTVTIYHGMRDHFIEGRRHDSCVTVTIYHGVCDRFIETLKAPPDGESNKSVTVHAQTACPFVMACVTVSSKVAVTIHA